MSTGIIIFSMTPIRTALLALVVAAGAASAQTSAPASPPEPTLVDSATLYNVTEYSVKSGKLLLASNANPIPVYLPDGTYTNEAGENFVISDGKIVRIMDAAGQTTDITNTRKNRFGLITLTPNTNALMAVSEMKLPSGNFTSDDGLVTFRSVLGRPTSFRITRAK
jgi:hypothetical protein